MSGEGAVNLSTHRLCCLSRDLQMEKTDRMLLLLKRLEQPKQNLTVSVNFSRAILSQNRHTRREDCFSKAAPFLLDVFSPKVCEHLLTNMSKLGTAKCYEWGQETSHTVSVGEIHVCSTVVGLCRCVRDGETIMKVFDSKNQSGRKGGTICTTTNPGGESFCGEIYTTSGYMGFSEGSRRI